MTTRDRSRFFKAPWPAFVSLVTVTLWVLLPPCPVPASDDAQEPAPEEWSEPARLAPQSLLLDAAHLDGRLVVVGERGHVLLSEDGGVNWTQARVPTRSLLTAATAVGGRYVWAVGHDSVILHSADAGSTWTRQFYAPEDERPLLDVWFENPEHGLAIGAYGLFLETKDGGKTWEERTVDQEERHWNAITAGPGGTLYVAAESGAVFRSADRGQSWELLETPYQGSYLGVLSVTNRTLLIFGLRGNVYRSADRGETWQHVPTDTTVTLMGGGQLSDGTVLIVGLSGAVLTSRDKGESFRTTNLPDRKALSTVIENGPRGLLLLGESGVDLMEEVPSSPST
ncbi:MAG: YCF48-related protein [bacterium]